MLGDLIVQFTGMLCSATRQMLQLSAVLCGMPMLLMTVMMLALSAL